MPLKNRRYYYSNLFLFTIVTFTVVLSTYTYIQFQGLESIQRNWIDYHQQIELKESLIFELKDSIGYGGGIHNFKNYLLRKEDKYYDLANDHFAQAQKLIKKIDSLEATSLEEKNQLDIIATHINKYQLALLKLHTIYSKNIPLSVTENERLVRISDSKAISAFSWFNSHFKSEKDRSTLALSNKVKSAKLSLLISMLFSIICFYLANFVTLKQTRKKLDKERRDHIHQSRLSAIGEMSGNIAHEINNPLAILSGAAEVIESCLAKENPPKEVLLKATQSIRTTVKRISVIVDGLKKLTRNDSIESQEFFELGAVLLEVTSLCEQRHKKANVSLSVPTNVNQIIFGHQVLISQVLINLINNSFQAVQELDDKWISISVLTFGEVIEISVTDSGKGIHKDIAEKLMTSFFTTKKDGEGTGVGLSICRNIIENHSGKLYYDSNSLNTRFVIQLPAAKKLRKAA